MEEQECLGIRISTSKASGREGTKLSVASLHVLDLSKVAEWWELSDIPSPWSPPRCLRQGAFSSLHLALFQVIL